MIKKEADDEQQMKRVRGKRERRERERSGSSDLAILHQMKPIVLSSSQ